jgi:hypothetical protein
MTSLTFKRRSYRALAGIATTIFKNTWQDVPIDSEEQKRKQHRANFKMEAEYKEKNNRNERLPRPTSKQSKHRPPKNCLERNEERGTTEAVDKAYHQLKIFMHIHDGHSHWSPCRYPLPSAGQMPPNIRIGQRENGKQDNGSKHSNHRNPVYSP